MARQALRRMFMCNLSQLNAGQSGTIAELNGDEHFVSRVTSIGLTVGCKLEVLQNHKKQPVLVYARDTMIAVHRSEAEKIVVEVSA